MNKTTLYSLLLIVVYSYAIDAVLVDERVAVSVGYPKVLSIPFEQTEETYQRCHFQVIVDLVRSNDSNILSLLQMQIDDNDLLVVKFHGDRRILANGFASSTLRTQGTLLLYTGSLPRGQHTIYLKLSLLSEAGEGTYYVRTQEVPIHSWLLSTLVVAGITILFAAFIIMLVFKVDRKNPFQFASFCFEMGSLSKLSDALYQHGAVRHIFLYFSVAAVYFVPAISLALHMFTEFSAGNQDLCSFNERCLHDVGSFPVFNNIVSNLSLMMLGCLCMVVVGVEMRSQGICPTCRARNQSECSHYTICLLFGPAMICAALMSGLFHTCPHVITYEFDLAFLVNVAWTGIVYVHTKIHRSQSFVFNVPSLYIAVALFGLASLLTQVLTAHSFMVVAVVTFAFVTHYLLGEAFLCLLTGLPLTQESYTLICQYGFSMTVSWVLLWEAWMGQLQFSTWIFGTVTLIFHQSFVFGIYEKWRRGESLSTRCLVFLVLSFSFEFSSLYFFSLAPSNRTLPAWGSRESNMGCSLFGMFDVHDIWHVLSSIGLACAVCGLLFLDDDLKSPTSPTVSLNGNRSKSTHE